jgi:hypothetical protein
VLRHEARVLLAVGVGVLVRERVLDDGEPVADRADLAGSSTVPSVTSVTSWGR